MDKQEKKFRKSIDLPKETVAVLQFSRSMAGFGTLKPYLEKILEEEAKRIKKNNPALRQAASKQLRKTDKEE